MSMTLSGDGTITGLVAGGLPDATVVDADLSLTANSAQVMVALNASGSAPIYACRAWVNFDGTGTPAIRASGNVSSITDNGTGDYTVNFTTAMEDADYCAVVSSARDASSSQVGAFVTNSSASAVNVIELANSTFFDSNNMAVAIFR